MSITPLRLAGATAAVLASYAAYEVRRLQIEYPYQRHPYTGPVSTVFPAGWSDPGRVTTTIANPPKAALADPLGTFLSAFYATWTLRLEGLGSRTIAYKSQLPAYLPTAASAAYAPPPGGESEFEFCSGLFRGVFRDEINTPRQKAGTAAVFWSMDPDHDTAFGGIQVLSAEINRTGELVLEFGGREVRAPWVDSMRGKALYWFHEMYARFLLDRARARLEKRAREGK